MKTLTKEECTNSMDISEYLLQHFPICRDDNHEMWFIYLEEFKSLHTLIGAEAYEKFRQLILDEKTLSIDSLVKNKSKFQLNGNYWGQKLIAKKKIDDMKASLREKKNDH